MSDTSGKMQVSLAPYKLWQAINPWTFYQQGAQFGLINIDLGRTSQPEVEKRILDEVGSYGKQLGHIGDALEVLLRHVDLKELSVEETLAIKTLELELATIKLTKEKARLNL